MEGEKDNGIINLPKNGSDIHRNQMSVIKAFFPHLAYLT